ncbi:VOC family protein [Actinokineospora sp. NBRC 105648]|nr:VOC family protein [Actinokineospora sp. NBRC 105648]GLZ38178.1 hypothetical protein Acsp05_18020 [Actinokineospora sp. NBRC 105648]
MSIAPQKITPFLTFEGPAEEALTLYTSLFDDAELLRFGVAWKLNLG